MRKINYLSDFDFILRLVDARVADELFAQAAAKNITIATT